MKKEEKLTKEDVEIIDKLNRDEGCSCKANMYNEIDHLVDEVEGYTTKEHAAKQKEVREAFAKKEKKS